jgi:hypothetical protein
MSERENENQKTATETLLDLSVSVFFGWVFIMLILYWIQTMSAPQVIIAVIPLMILTSGLGLYLFWRAQAEVKLWLNLYLFKRSLATYERYREEVRTLEKIKSTLSLKNDSQKRLWQCREHLWQAYWKTYNYYQELHRAIDRSRFMVERSRNSILQKSHKLNRHKLKKLLSKVSERDQTLINLSDHIHAEWAKYPEP